MRIFLPFISFLLFHASVLSGAHGMNEVGVQVGVPVENSGSTRRDVSEEPGLPPTSSPSNEEASSAYPPLSYIWDHLQVFGENAQNLGREMLREAGESYPSSKFGEVIASMEELISRTAALRSTLEAHGITMDDVSNALEGVFATLSDELKQAFPHPDKAPSHDQRNAMVSHVLDRVELALMNLGARYKMDEDTFAGHWEVIKQYIRMFVVTVGDLIEQYPLLFDMLFFSISMMFIPEQWLLRPLLSILGFGPAGPVKGSAAAAMQRRFWGAAVQPGSWFAFLQRAGMKLSFPPGTFGAIMGGVGAAMGAGAGIVKSYFGSWSADTH